MIENPILLDLPMPITTQRLVIRPREPGMGKIVNECVLESFDSFNRYFAWAKNKPTIEDTEINLREGYADYILRKVFHMGVFAGDALVAAVSFHNINWTIRSAEIGYWCRTSTEGQGYVTEAVRAWTRYGFEQIGFRRLVIACDDDNSKSWGVAERAGYVLEVRALGLATPVHGDALVMNRRYVRFDAQGLQDDTVTWPTKSV